MGRDAGAELPPRALDLLAHKSVDELDGETFLLITSSADGWPHLAMLSAGEVLATDAETLRFALWPDSIVARRLVAHGRGLLSFVHAATAYSVRFHAASGASIAGMDGRWLASFQARVVQVREDVAPYAVLEHGVRFRLREPESTLARWSDTRRALAEQVFTQETM